MSKKFLLILICLFLVASLALFTACSRDKEETGNIMEKNTYLEDGNLLEIALEANSTTGYTWQCEISDESVISLKSSDYIPDAHEPGFTGAGGTKRFTFEGKKEGTAQIRLLYYRTFEKGEYTPDYIITVRTDGNLCISVENISSANGKTLIKA